MRVVRLTDRHRQGGFDSFLDRWVRKFDQQEELNESAHFVNANDAQDIQDTLDGDDQAYARLVARYQVQIGRRMRRFTRDQVLLEELVQEVFVEAYQSLEGYARDAPFEHWLSRIATRTGYRFWTRREKARTLPMVPAEELENVAAASDPPNAGEDAAEQVHRLLQRLKPRDRLVLTLMYLEDASVAQIADQTGWSVAMVKVQAHRARSRFKAILEQEGME